MLCVKKIINGGLDQYGAEPCEQQLFGTVALKGLGLIVDFCHVN